MAELECKGTSAKALDLMAQADDTEGLRSSQPFGALYTTGDGFRISRALGKHDRLTVLPGKTSCLITPTLAQ